MLEAFYRLLQLLDAGEEALGYLPGIGGDVHAFLAVEAGRGASFDGVLELFAASAAGAESGCGLGLGHWRDLLN